MITGVTTLLESLAGCLCATMAEEQQPPVCFCGVLPGDGIVAGYGTSCDDVCGLAWVRLTSMYPASGTGVATFTPGNCGNLLGLDIEVGILRCIPVGDESGEGPTGPQLLAAAEQQATDAIVMRQAITCCPALDPKDFMMGNYTPGGPLGGMLGGTWSVSVAI